MQNVILKLERFGISNINHTHSSLLSHLKGTYEILQKWDCEKYICLAGLCHSIYGTESFLKSPASLENRDYLSELIGVEAERLTYLFGAHKKDSLWENLAKGNDFCIEDRFANKVIFISAKDFSNLITITHANWLEQRPRAKSEFHFLRQQEFLQSKVYLTEHAFNDFLIAYGLDK